MAKAYETVYTDKLTDGFRLIVGCIRYDDEIYYVWKIETLELDGTVFGVTSDGESYESKSAAEVSGRFFFLMNYARS